MWAEQPLQQEHIFTQTLDRSSLTKLKGGESIEALCKTTATIIFYKLPADTDSCLRYINALDFSRPATGLRVIKPKGNRAGEAHIPVVITKLTAYTWRLLEQRVVYFTHNLAVGIRHAVNDENICFWFSGFFRSPYSHANSWLRKCFHVSERELPPLLRSPPLLRLTLEGLH
jgi:hypothetical protein